MEWSTVIFLTAAMASLVGLMAVIIFGVKRSAEYKELEKKLNLKAKNLDSERKEFIDMLKAGEEEKEKILGRLKNLEAIVTSEAWESVHSGGGSDKNIQIHLEEENEESDDTDKAAKIAKKVR